jgi:hypothetical protein
LGEFDQIPKLADRKCFFYKIKKLNVIKKLVPHVGFDFLENFFFLRTLFAVGFDPIRHLDIHYKFVFADLLELVGVIQKFWAHDLVFGFGQDLVFAGKKIGVFLENRLMVIENLIFHLIDVIRLVLIVKIFLAPRPLPSSQLAAVFIIHRSASNIIHIFLGTLPIPLILEFIIIAHYQKISSRLTIGLPLFGNQTSWDIGVP